MATAEFDIKFQKLTAAMVEIAFEYVGRNKEEIDTVYIYGSMETGSYSYNCFYVVNNVLSKKQNINNYLKEPLNVSSEQQQSLMRIGNKLLQETAEVFKADNREIPTLLKMIFHPKSGNFKCNISYDLHYSNHPEWTNVDVFNQWVEEIKNGLN